MAKINIENQRPRFLKILTIFFAIGIEVGWKIVGFSNKEEEHREKWIVSAPTEYRN